MSTHFNMNALDWSAFTLLVVGALNWGLVGIGLLLDANWNLVALLLGSVPALEAAIYVLVGLAGLYAIYLAARLAGVDIPEPTMETTGRKQAK
jgi:hypothetical protein